jgi:hypothetical protein
VAWKFASFDIRGVASDKETLEISSGKMMPVEDKKISPKKEAAAETKPAEATLKAEKPDAAAKKQGMGEGQKPVSQAYKDNWNAIFGKTKKR